MSRLPKWTNSFDNQKRFNLQHTWRIGIEECTLAIGYLIYWDADSANEDLEKFVGKFSKVDVINQLKQELPDKGENFYYPDDLPEKLIDFAAEEARRIFAEELK